MEKLKKNRIPRKFNRIIVEMLIDTSCNKVGDILHIYKNDCGSNYLALNKRTGNYAYMFASMLRNNDLCKIIQIEV